MAPTQEGSVKPTVSRSPLLKIASTVAIAYDPTQSYTHEVAHAVEVPQ
jgi:hypothetical protein